MNHCQHLNLTIKRMVNLGGGKMLPREFQQVEYLQSSGTQWINTGVNNTDFTDYYCKINIQSYNSTNYIFGTWGNNARCFVSFNKAPEPEYTWLGYSNGYASTSALALNTNLELSGLLKLGQQTLNINGSNVISMSVSASINPSMPMYLYGVNWTGYNAARFCLSARIYRFVLANSGVNVIDFIPCYRKSDSKPGMYDIINNAFYYNQGTGEFATGNNV